MDACDQYKHIKRCSSFQMIDFMLPEVHISQPKYTIKRKKQPNRLYRIHIYKANTESYMLYSFTHFLFQ